MSDPKTPNARRVENGTAPATRNPDTWRSQDITLIGRRVTIVLDGRTLVDDQEIAGITGGALDRHEALPWPIYLRGSEAGRVAFRNILVRPARLERAP